MDSVYMNSKKKSVTNRNVNSCNRQMCPQNCQLNCSPAPLAAPPCVLSSENHKRWAIGQFFDLISFAPPFTHEFWDNFTNQKCHDLYQKL